MVEAPGVEARCGARRAAAAVATACLFAAVGCAAKRPPADGEARWPGGKRWGASAVRALRDPRTWAPAAGAGLALAADWDRGISDWAVENTPVFGSAERATDTGDYLEAATYLSMVSTAIAAPRGDRAWDSDLGRLGVEHAALLSTELATGALKGLGGRERPNGRNDESFPSGHASRAFSNVAMGWRNLDTTPMSGGVRSGLKAGFELLAVGTAWSRVESGAHYLSDVLAGAALGNFVSLLVHDAFLPPRGRPRRPEVLLSIQPDGILVGLHWELNRPSPRAPSANYSNSERSSSAVGSNGRSPIFAPQ